MRKEILNFVNTRCGSVSFAELDKHIVDFRGKAGIGITEKNIWFWLRCSETAAATLEALIKEKTLKVTPTTPLVYFVDGAVPALPVAKKMRQYKTARWLPVVLDIVKKR